MDRRLAVFCVLTTAVLLGVSMSSALAGERHRTTVSLNLSGALVATGEVRATDGTRGCEARREVVIQRRGGGGGWQTIEAQDSRPSGLFRIELPGQAGDYRALIKKLEIASGTCTRDVSPVETHGGGGDNNCTQGYSPCLVDHGGADYDCYGGSGNGPYYTEPGIVYTVSGSDPYGLDADNDGLGCE